MNDRGFNKSRGFTLIELMIVISIIGLLAAIGIPQFIGYRNKAFCSETETNADHVAVAISDYYAMPHRTSLPAIGDLGLTFANPSEIQGDPNTTITILVTDRTGRCPEDYQNANINWTSAVFTKYIN